MLRSKRKGVQKGKIEVMKQGIDLDQFPYEPKTFIRPHKVRVLSVGRLTEKKGMHYLIEAFAELIQTYPQAKLVIMGEGEQREFLEYLIEWFGLQEYVELMGMKDPDEVREQLIRCDIFALMSTTVPDGCEETIPRALMEAMATGRIVISADHGSILQLVQHQITGYLVPEKDVKALTDMMKYVLSHPKDRKNMIELARKKVVEVHDINIQARKLDEWIFDM